MGSYTPEGVRMRGCAARGGRSHAREVNQRVDRFRTSESLQMTELATAVSASGGRGDRRKARSKPEAANSAKDGEEQQPRAKRCRLSPDSSAASLTLSQRFWELEQRMCRELASLDFSQPVTHIYNPLNYAREPHQCYLDSYIDSPKRVMFFGMNPGPFGMAQTGVCTPNIMYSAVHVNAALYVEDR